MCKIKAELIALFVILCMATGPEQKGAKPFVWNKMCQHKMCQIFRPEQNVPAQNVPSHSSKCPCIRHGKNDLLHHITLGSCWWRELEHLLGFVVSK